MAIIDWLKSLIQPLQPARYHLVQSGDTLSGIAKDYYGSADKFNTIFNANRDILSDPNKIHVGQRLRIPYI